MRRRFLLLFTPIVMLAAAATASAQLSTSDDSPLPPATQADRPISPSDAQLRQWIAQLDDDDFDVREAARDSLMELRREDLDALKAAAMAMQPLSPEQVASLHAIVRQTYLASELYDSGGGSGFLGLHWPEQMQGSNIHDVGVIVADRIVGFCGNRTLREGDVIVKILEHPELDLRRRDRFIAAIQMSQAGDKLHLQILRFGKLIEVPIVLDPRPNTGLGDISVWVRNRNEKADLYWNQEFSDVGGPLADDDSAPASTTQP